MDNFNMQTFKYNNDRLNFISIIGRVQDIKQFDTQFKSRYMTYDGGAILKSIEELDDLNYNNYLYYRILSYSSLVNTHAEENTKCYVTFIHNIVEKEGYSFNNIINLTADDYLNSDRQINKVWGTPQDLGYMRVFGMNEVNKLLCHNLDIVTEVVYCFRTNHSKCKPVVEVMKSRYPNLFFRYIYKEVNSLFSPEVGLCEYENGRLIKDIETKPYKVGVENTGEFMKEYLEDKYYACSRCGSEDGSPVPWLVERSSD